LLSGRSSRPSDSDARRPGERGFAVVGAAVTLPLVLLGSIGMVEIGRAFETSQALRQAASEGARAAIRPDTDTGRVDANVREHLRTSGLRSDGAVGVRITGSDVTISYPFQFVVLQPVAQLLVSGSMVDSPITVTMSAKRNEAGS
jgi:TadE-like protein